MRHVVFGGQALGVGRLGPGLRGVALVAHCLARRARRRLQRLAVGGRVVRGVRAVVPFDLQRIAALAGGPGIARDDGNAAQRLEGRRALHGGNLHDLQHAGNGERLGAVHAAHPSAHHGRTRDHGIHHAGQPHVHAVGGLAFADGFQVDEADLFLADVPELGPGLQLEGVAGRHGLFGGVDGQVAIRQAAPRGQVHHLMLLGLDLADGHGPARGCGSFQHLPGRRAHAPHRHQEVAHAARAVHVLVAVARLVGGRLDDLHALPARLHFVGHHHGQAGAYARAHLGAVRHDGDGAIGGDADEDERIVHGAAGHAVGAVLAGLGLRGRGCRDPPLCRHGQGEGAQAALQKGAARKVSGGGHCLAPWASWRAACWMAARMRGYVPQRQILPLIASAISCSVGCGAAFKRLTAVMICPAWQ